MVGEFSGWTVYRNGQSEVMANRPSLEELERLYSSLTPEERDELLQCLLIAAPRGGEAMLKTLEDHLLCAASETFMTTSGWWVPGEAFACQGALASVQLRHLRPRARGLQVHPGG